MVLLKLRFASGKVWRYVIASISKIIDEGVFIIGEDGVRLRAMDPSKIALVDFHLPRESFTEFEVTGVENISVNMSDLAKILKRAVKDDELVLESSGAKGLTVSFVGHGIRSFTLPSLELAPEELPELKLDFPVMIRAPPSVFKEIVRELEPVGEVIEFKTVSPENTLIARSYSDIVDAQIVLSVQDGSLYELSAREDSVSSYSIDYLIDIAGVSSVAEDFVFEYGSGLPCRLQFTLPYGGKIVFYVAPRVE